MNADLHHQGFCHSAGKEEEEGQVGGEGRGGEGRGGEGRGGEGGEGRGRGREKR